MIDLVTREIAATVIKNGTDEIILSPPANLKIQTTGEGGEMLFNEGPSRDKTWTVNVRLEIIEN